MLVICKVIPEFEKGYSHGKGSDASRQRSKYRIDIDDSAVKQPVLISGTQVVSRRSGNHHSSKAIGSCKRTV